MSILLRAAVLGGIAYLISRSLSGQSMQRRTYAGGGRPSRLDDLHPGENSEHMWPTSESQDTQRTTAAAGPGS